MSDKGGTPAPNNAAGASNAASTSNGSSGASSAAAAPKKAAPEGNPAFRMMGLPRLRLPSRNWLIFLSITGGFASAVYYDKYQTRRTREKWCNLVTHIAGEHLDTHQLPRRMTVYLAAPPGDGLRAAREHFHNYVKPVLVAAAMDWDVVEGRKEGDVRYKTAERIRKRRRTAGEGKPDEQEQDTLTVDAVRKNAGTREYDGIAGDLVIGRHTWKEYIRGQHEGWLGPVDAPAPIPEETPVETPQPDLTTSASLSDTTVKTAVTELSKNSISTPEAGEITQDASPTEETQGAESKEEEKKKDDKPKPRQPPPYIQPTEYTEATVSPNIADLIGPSIGIRFPHLLGFRNTPIRIYRFLNRRHLADSVGRDVATAVLASYRPYDSFASDSDISGESSSAAQMEQATVLAKEERDWWKTTYQPRKEHEESVWIEDMVLDERVAGRMRAFQLTSDDEDRAKRLWKGEEKVQKRDDDEI